MKRTIITILVIVVAIAGAAFVLKGNKEKMQEQIDLAKKTNATVPVQVAEARHEQIGGSFTATGVFTPSRQITVVTELAGKVVSLPVDEGDHVTKGQLLARIDYVTTEAELNSAEANLKKVTTDKERYERLVKTGGVTQAQLDDAILAYVNAEARVVNARKKLNDSYIRAPFAGYVNKRFVEEGSYLNAAKEVFEIVETSKISMIVSVPENQVMSVSEAKEIIVNADVYPGVDYKAKVKFIAAKADANLNFPVELEITNVNAKPLRAGMYGRASFNLPAVKSSLVIPRAALIGSIDDGQVYVVRGDSVTLTKLVAGRVFANTVEVVSGLTEGDRVVTNGQINLMEGTKVTVLTK